MKATLDRVPKVTTLVISVAAFFLGVVNSVWMCQQTQEAKRATMTQNASYRLQKIATYIQFGDEHQRLKNKSHLNQGEEVRLQYLDRLLEEITDQGGIILYPKYEATSNINLRSDPDPRADVIGYIKKGEILTVYNEFKWWDKDKYLWFEVEVVRNGPRVRGWAYAVDTMISVN